MSSRKFVAISLFALTIGCGDSQRVTGPPQTAAPEPPPATTDFSVMVPSSPTSLMVFPGGPALSLPTVQIVLSGANTPVQGVRVSFSFSDGTRESALTDKDGYARADKWQLDYSKSSERVIATADDVRNSIEFTATIRHDVPVATYELQTVGGKGLPLTYSGGGRSWDITGGRYVLFADGTYIFGYEVDGKQGWRRLYPFVRRDSSIEFYLDAAAAPQSRFYAERNYLFSTGRLNGTTMEMSYEDFIDFEAEVYLAKQ